jgi:hypothetical protein
MNIRAIRLLVIAGLVAAATACSSSGSSPSGTRGRTDLSTVTSTNWNPSDLVQVGVQFYTGGRPEAGRFLGPNPVVLNIDTITE